MEDGNGHDNPWGIVKELKKGAIKGQEARKSGDADVRGKLCEDTREIYAKTPEKSLRWSTKI